MARYYAEEKVIAIEQAIGGNATDAK